MPIRAELEYVPYIRPRTTETSQTPVLSPRRTASLTGPSDNLSRSVVLEDRGHPFALPSRLHEKVRCHGMPGLANDGVFDVREVSLCFSVSLDEEHVQVTATNNIHTFDLGARAHHYLLLTLARRRLADRRDGFPETACGWIDYEDLANDRTMDPPRVNIHVFRLRRQMAALGFANPQEIVERRRRNGKLRIGCADLTVSRL